MGFKIGMGGVITYKNSGLEPVIEAIDLENIILETDSPYLTPVPNRGKRNESANLVYIVRKIAEIKGITIEELQQK
jgi:TatD DNase family protein